MAIPGFQVLLYPVLVLLSDGEPHPVTAIRSAMAERFALTPDELVERLPSGKGRTFNNRVAWSLVHLKGGGFVESPERAMYAITDTGRELLQKSTAGDGLRLRHLKEYEQYREFRRPTKASTTANASDQSTEDDETTPEERIELAMRDLRAGVAAEVLDRLLKQTPEFFEQVVLDVLQAMGYGKTGPESAQHLGRSGDGGIDGVIREDRLGLDLIYVQAKRWIPTVGRPDIQQFVGALNGQLAKKGVFITTSSFSREAIEYAAGVSPRVVLIDGKELAEYMVEYEVGASHGAAYRVPAIDVDYFETDDVVQPTD